MIRAILNKLSTEININYNLQAIDNNKFYIEYFHAWQL